MPSIPGKVALLGVPYDAGSSYQRGAAGAPLLIREALWSEAGNTWTETGIDLKEGGLEDEGDLWFNEREPGLDRNQCVECERPVERPSGLRDRCRATLTRVRSRSRRGVGRCLESRGDRSRRSDLARFAPHTRGVERIA